MASALRPARSASSSCVSPAVNRCLRNSRPKSVWRLVMMSACSSAHARSLAGAGARLALAFAGQVPVASLSVGQDSAAEPPLYRNGHPVRTSLLRIQSALRRIQSPSAFSSLAIVSSTFASAPRESREGLRHRTEVMALFAPPLRWGHARAGNVGETDPRLAARRRWAGPGRPARPPRPAVPFEQSCGQGIILG